MIKKGSVQTTNLQFIVMPISHALLEQEINYYQKYHNPHSGKKWYS